MIQSHISKVGLEIEGGWAGEPGVSPFSDVSLIQDNSINGQTLCTWDHFLEATHIGEVISPPLPYLGGSWKPWLLEHWPNAAPPNRTNRTCGYHIHISLESLKDYTLLTSKVFLFKLRERLISLGVEKKLSAKHPFWGRMGGDNTFCTFYFSAPKQMALKTKQGIHRTRYGWLNFASQIHGTVEFRALPTFDESELALFFTESYFNCVDSYLDAAHSQNLSLSATF